MGDTDRTPTVDQQATDGTRQDATVTVQEAARILNVSTDAVRSRLRRGTLEGHKQGDEWRVQLPGSSGATVDRQDTDRTQQDATGNRQDATVGGDRMRQDAGAVDLAPLAELIERQARELAEMREAAAVWQIRARQAEARLEALEAGTSPAGEPVQGTSPEPPESPVRDETREGGIRAWWRRLWGD